MKKMFILFFALFVFGGTAAFARVPNDPNVMQWAYTDTNVYEAWDRSVGSHDVVVAVIDNGFDRLHPDLKENVWNNTKEIPDNGIDDDQNGYIDDVWGWNFVENNNRPEPNVEKLTSAQTRDEIFHHGTIVAGIIGAMGNNGFAGVGINWNVSLMNIKVANNDGFGNSELLARAIRYAVDNGAHIINVSMVGDTHADVLRAVEYAYEKDVTIIAAAGNNARNLNNNPLYPICADAGSDKQMVLGVSAINEQHMIARFSNIGSSCVDITAPGQDIASTILYAPRHGLSTAYREGWTGTSISTPLVTGAAALIKSVQPTWGPDNIYEALLSTTHQTPSSDPAGYAQLFGAGLLQVNKAVAYAQSKKTGASSVMLVDVLGGRIVERVHASESGNVKAPQALRGIDSMATYVDADGVRQYVLAKRFSAAEREVIRYNEQWRIMDRWTVPAAQPITVLATDVSGGEDVEIVIAPKEQDRTVFTVYTLAGDMVKTYSTEAQHNGVSIAAVQDIGMQKSELLVLYNKEKSLVLERVTGDAVQNATFPISSFAGPGSLIAADTDGDGTKEYILAAPANHAPVVMYLGADGKTKRKFFAYDSTYRDGISLMATSFIGNGHEQVITVPHNNGAPVRVWENSSRFFEEWQAFGDAEERILQAVN